MYRGKGATITSREGMGTSYCLLGQTSHLLSVCPYEANRDLPAHRFRCERKPCFLLKYTYRLCMVWVNMRPPANE